MTEERPASPERSAPTYQSSTKRIAKNTIALYIRMFLLLLVNLYTSRVVLEVLGVIDFGIYNVVCGLVSVFSFINGTLASGTQRFLNISMGKGDETKLKKTFNTAFLLHLFLAGLVVILIEAVGLWLLYNKLVIPADKMTDAFWIFQFNVIVCALQITQAPYMASIVAHEKLDVYAYIGIFDVVMKLCVVLPLYWIDCSKLIVYGMSLMIVQIIDILIYHIYCIRNFKETRLCLDFDKEEVKQILVFSGWNIIGCMAVPLNVHGFNVLLNMFFGPVVNTARAISMQVNGAANLFASNLQTAVNPQIVKLYAQSKKTETYHLICNNAKYAACLMLILIIPLFLEMDFVLRIWLGDNNVPDYTVSFAQILLVQTLVTTISRPLVTGIHAIGKMKIPNLISGSVLMLIIPVSYLLLKHGISVVFVYWTSLIPWLFELCFSIYYVSKQIGKSSLYFIMNVLVKIMFILGLSMVVSLSLHLIMKQGWTRLIAIAVIGEAWTLFVICKFGLGESMKMFVKSKLLKLIRR